MRGILPDRTEKQDAVEDMLTLRYGKARKCPVAWIKWLTDNEYDQYSYCLDHLQYRRKNGKRAITARPYTLGIEDLEALVSLAKSKNLTLIIEGCSNYNDCSMLVILSEK